MITFSIEKTVAKDIRSLAKEIKTGVERLQKAEILISYSIAENYDRVWLLLIGEGQSHILQIVESCDWTLDFNYEINELLDYHQVIRYSKSSIN